MHSISTTGWVKQIAKAENLPIYKAKRNRRHAKFQELNPLSMQNFHKLCIISLLFCASISANSQVFVDSGACPFECCKYGTWTAIEPVPAFLSPGNNDSLTCMISAGESFHAITGEAHVMPVNFLFETQVDNFNFGDTISLLNYLGEGVFKAKTKMGQVISIELDFSPYEKPKNGKESKLGRLLQPYTFQWWVKIKCQNGKFGWIDARQNISGRDGCE